jgi:proline iminopeptidase
MQTGGPGLSWNYLRMPELEKHLTLVYLEPVGSGGSGRLADPQDYTRPRWVADLEAFRQHLGLDKICLLGHSHGGFVAQDYAIAHGAHLGGLILYATSPRLDRDFVLQAQANIKAREGKPWQPDAAAAFVSAREAKTEQEAASILRRAVPLYVEDYEARKAEIDRLTAEISFNPDAGHGRRTPFDVREALKAVRVPTLVLSAEHDFICDPRFGREIHEAIAGSTFVVVPAAGHMAHWDQPAAVAKAVADFIATVER